MTKRSGWIDVDPDGLAEIIGDRGKEFIVFELLQNAWDEASSYVSVEFYPLTGERNQYRITVLDDNPTGFVRLSDAFTLFAPSLKKGDPEKRGRFNMGEKLVLALAISAEIRTTKGTVFFNEDGTRSVTKKAPTSRGSIIHIITKMTKSEYEQALKAVYNIVPPSHIATTINSLTVHRPRIEHTFETTLPTVISDGSGVLRTSARKTKVEVVPQFNGEAWLYEMGIPVVQTEDKWSYNVLQKVPLNSERTDVTPAYKKVIRVEVLNAMFNRLSADDSTQAWVRDASADPNAVQEAVEIVMTLRFGEKRVAFDPSDPEANKVAMSKGYTVIPGRALSAGEWTNTKRFGTVLPAGQVTPSEKPFSENGRELKTIPTSSWTDTMNNFAVFAGTLALELTGGALAGLVYANDTGFKHGAACGPDRVLYVNWLRYSGWVRAAFERRDRPALERVLAMIIHEFAHFTVTDHLDEAFFTEVQRLGGKLAVLALRQPELFPR